LESLQFEFAEIEAATNRFATENRIGKGGFGEVYKVNISSITLNNNITKPIFHYDFFHMLFREFFWMDKKLR